MMQFYWYFFEDGYRACVAGYSENELRIEVSKHGRVVRKEKA